MVFIVGILKSYIMKLVKPAPSSDPSATKVKYVPCVVIGQCLRALMLRAQMLQRNSGWLMESSVASRVSAYTHPERGLLRADESEYVDDGDDVIIPVPL